MGRERDSFKEEIDQLELKIKIYEGGKQEVVKLLFIRPEKETALKRIKVVAEDVKVVLDIGRRIQYYVGKDFDDYVDTYK